MRTGASSKLSNDAMSMESETRLTLFRMMMMGRVFETRVNELFLEGLVRGTTHLGIGQEAVAAGFAHAMRRDDLTFCTYRGHLHTLLRGANPTYLMAELLGKATGICGGKGGSMHLTDVTVGAMGSYAIVGAHLPIAVGAAWAAKERETQQVSVCFFGDGATNIGAFHEALNLAVVWELPVVFVCENNLYMEYTHISSMTAVANPAADRAGSYGLSPLIVDGNDVDAVHSIAQDAISAARADKGPQLIEAKTYRQGGHSRGDPGKYRPAEEVERWLARDPIDIYRGQLTDLGTPSERLDEIERNARRETDEATNAARAAPPPSPHSLETDLWADGSAQWRN